jgi:RimJ/RimL family protein N-acetyltransferase
LNVSIVPPSDAHFEGLYSALDTVAREKRYLAFLQAPPKHEAFAFYRDIVDGNHCQFVALGDGAVVGWCDVLPTRGEVRAHVGTLGIALVPAARRAGIGARLMERVISQAWERGLTRIELTVRADNTNARALYERFGFLLEGLHRRAFRVDGEYFDTCAMALLR